VARRLARAHGGDLRVASNPGGCRFIATLPRFLSG
jgi:signal transduction histidine kinase